MKIFIRKIENMNFNLNIPNGTRDLLFSEVKTYEAVSRSLSDIYERGGFQPVMTPAVEYYDVFDCDKSIKPESMYKLSDMNGRLIVFRADNTLPMVRVAATKLRHENMPLRLCYNQSIYRIANGYSGRRSEILQSGVEIIGDTGVRGDLVCASTAIEALSSLGADFKLEIGNVGFYNELISELNLSESESAELRTNVEHKNLGKIAEYGKIASIPLLYGGREVLEKAAAIAGDNKAALDAVNYVGNIYDTLVSSGAGDHVIIDMGLVHEIDYYTGLVFRGYMDGAGEPVLAGGRYDSLSSCFGLDAPATGFAVNVSLAADTMIRKNGLSERITPVYLVHFDPENFDAAEKFVRENAESGIICELSMYDSYEKSVEYAAMRSIRKIAYVDGEGVRITERGESK